MTASTTAVSADPSLAARRQQALSESISAARSALSNFQFGEVVAHCEAALSFHPTCPEEQAALRRLLAEAKESLSLYTEALRSLENYERMQARVAEAAGAAHPDAPAPSTPPTPPQHSLPLPGLVYSSEAMRRVAAQVYSLAASDTASLITGESGTGKELVARAIHALSRRADAPFAPFNCAAAPRELIESHLFGHRRGAFTGAGASSPGIVGAAAGGTLFLDEVGELSREVQPKLLRFLQNGEVQRLGETSPREVDVRVIAATNRDLAAMVAAGEFRADLYYRLNVIQLHLPPLRERREEIPSLAAHLLARCAAQSGKSVGPLDAETARLLTSHDWPGNVRQLENEIRRLVTLAAASGRVTADLLSPEVAAQAGDGAVPARAAHTTLAEALAEVKRRVIGDALMRHQGNLSRVAGELGVSRFGLRKMLVQLRLGGGNQAANAGKFVAG